MSMLSAWTIGAMASKKASWSWPVSSSTTLVRAGEVRGPVARMVEPQVGRRRRADLAGLEPHQGMGLQPLGHRIGEAVAVDRQRPAGGHLVLVGGGEDQRAHRAHLGVQQAHRIVLPVVGAERVGADQLGEAAGLVHGRGGPRAAFRAAPRELRPRRSARRLPIRPGRPRRHGWASCRALASAALSVTCGPRLPRKRFAEP